MTNELYHVAAWQEEEAGRISCIIHYNKASAVFNGHFPGNQIVPGVCTMQMVMDLLQQAVQQKLRLISAPNVKFLQLIRPDVVPTASIAWTVSDDGYNVNATLKDGDVVLFKMSGNYAVRN